MKHVLKFVAFSGLATLITACGGSDPAAPSFQGLLSASDAMTSAYSSASVRATDLPASGSADYHGYVTGDLTESVPGDTGSVMGTLAMTASFGASDTGTLSGSVTNVMHSTDGTMSGTLNVDGAFNASLGLQADVTGTLDDAYDVDLAMDGDFVGGAADTVPDAALGTVDGFLTPTDTGPSLFFENGAFVAEAQ